MTNTGDQVCCKTTHRTMKKIQPDLSALSAFAGMGRSIRNVRQMAGDVYPLCISPVLFRPHYWSCRTFFNTITITDITGIAKWQPCLNEILGEEAEKPSFQLIVNHNDAVREFAYQEKINASLDEAVKNKWHVVDMKNDWKTIFPKINASAN